MESQSSFSIRKEEPLGKVLCMKSCIDFGIGQPQLEILPRDLLWRASQTQFESPGNENLNYGPYQGSNDFRQALSRFLSPHYGALVEPDSILATNGSSHALHLISHLFAEPGDTILVEEPSYFLALEIFRDRGLNLVGVPLSRDGFDLKKFEKLVKKHKPKLFYTIPVHQNPTGYSLTEETKKKLISLAEKYEFHIVADEVYQLLTYSGATPPPFANSVDSDRVLAVSSFSKILAPGLRLGWIQASPSNIGRLSKIGVLRSGGGFNPYIGSVVTKALESGACEAYLHQIKSYFSHRIEIMDHHLSHHLGDVLSYDRPTGGYFFWLKLPQDTNCTELAEKARDYGTGFRAGALFSSQDGLENYLRLSFAHFSENAISVGLDRFTELVRDNW